MLLPYKPSHYIWLRKWGKLPRSSPSKKDVLLEGGLPIITKSGQHIGSIGISGANPEVDGRCAQAALDSIAEFL